MSLLIALAEYAAGAALAVFLSASALYVALAPTPVVFPW